MSTADAFIPPYSTVEAITPKEIAEGVSIRIFSGRAMTLSYVTVARNAVVPTHAHPHEQLGIVLDGEMEFWIEGEERLLKRGDVYRIAPNTEHGARGGEAGCVVLDVFSPVREDYEALYED
jgi:quercetin dioxygenase-like cupin family protein